MARKGWTGRVRAKMAAARPRVIAGAEKQRWRRLPDWALVPLPDDYQITASDIDQLRQAMSRAVLLPPCIRNAIEEVTATEIAIAGPRRR